MKQASTVAALKASDVRVVSPATPSKSAHRPGLPLNLALGALIVMLFACCYTLLRERNDASLRSPGQSLKHLNVPELAVIPSARIGNRERIPLTLRNLNGANSAAMESKNGLITASSAAVDKEMRTSGKVSFSVTCPYPGRRDAQVTQHLVSRELPKPQRSASRFQGLNGAVSFSMKVRPNTGEPK